MRRNAFFVLTLLFASTAFAQSEPRPVVDEVTPAYGPAEGGTRVSISGRNLGLPANFACILPCPARVTFGSVTVSVDYESDSLLVARAPAHVLGSVDVTVITGDGRTTTVPAAFTYRSSPESAYEKILIPIYVDGHIDGAYGSRWETRFALRNNGKEPLRIAPWPCPADGICPAVFPNTFTLEPGTTLRSIPPFFRQPSPNRSRVLYLSTPNDISANLRVVDVSRDQLDAGAELAIVRERNLLTGTARLHEVALQPRMRLMLRIYDLERTDSRFRVRIFAEESDDAAKEVELQVTLSETGEFRSQAAYVEYVGLESGLSLPAASAIRVEVEPLTPGSRYWTFIAITNNETQRATYVTPQ